MISSGRECIQSSFINDFTVLPVSLSSTIDGLGDLMLFCWKLWFLGLIKGLTNPKTLNPRKRTHDVNFVALKITMYVRNSLFMAFVFRSVIESAVSRTISARLNSIVRLSCGGRVACPF